MIYQFEDGFERPIEDLMWRVVLLVLSGGWRPEWDVSQRQFIVNRIAELGLELLLIEVPAKEADLFRHDLKILKLV